MTEQILSLPLHVFMIIVKADTQVAICLLYCSDILDVSFMRLRVYVDRIRLISFIYYDYSIQIKFIKLTFINTKNHKWQQQFSQLQLCWIIIIFMNHYQQVFSNTPPPFGKNQRTIAIAVFLGFQSLLYFFGLLSIYALATVKINLIILLGTISLLQSFVSRSQGFIDVINDILQVRRYSKGFQLIYQQNIEQNNKCLFGMHPHGVLSSAMLASMNLKNGPLSKVVGLSSRFMLSCPVVGLFLRLWGVQSVDNKHMKALMREGKIITLMPGGFEEATLTTPKELRLFIKSRKGFIKYAMEHNYSIYPILYLNEHRAFWTFDYFTKFRLFLNKLKLSAVLFWNMKTLLFLPPYMEYVSIVGKKINYRLLKEGELPTKAQIDQTHFHYIEQIKRIYQKYRHLNGDVPMKIY